MSGALLCLDVTEGVIAEAVERGCSLVVSHHPLLFRPLKRITGGTDVERTVAAAIKGGVAVLSMHTNLDNAVGGVNHEIASRLGLRATRMLAPKPAVSGVEAGGGVIGELPEEVSADDFVERVRQAFAVKAVRCNELLRRPVRSVAVCGGAGDFLLPEAIAAGADAFLTGEMHYHVYAGHGQQLQICVIGHYESEQYTVDLLERILAERCPELRTVRARTVTNPIIEII